MSKRVLVMFGIMAAVVGGGAVALAQTAPAGVDDTTLTGKGFLRASGSGTVSIEMTGLLRMAVDGDVVIVDRAGDARVHIEAPGARAETAEALRGGPTYELSGFQGVVRVAGSDFSVDVDGFAAFTARGEGAATLAGEGVWKTRHRWGFWSESGTELSLTG